MFTAISLLGGALLLVTLAAWLIPGLRAEISKPSRWLGLIIASALLSLVSSFVSSRRHSGTGDLTSHGWPKPFYFRWESWESADRSVSANPLYFAGNMMVYVAALLVAGMVWHVVRRAR
jgi:hypothetical protein